MSVNKRFMGNDNEKVERASFGSTHDSVPDNAYSGNGVERYSSRVANDTDPTDVAEKRPLSPYALTALSTRDANHNETDFDGFRQFHEKREKEYESTRKNSYREQLERNVEQWDDNVPSQYKGLTLRGAKESGAKKIINKISTPQAPRSLFIFATNPQKRERLVYSLLRDYVVMGKASWSTTCHLTENDLTTWATIGFEGAQLFRSQVNDTVDTIVVHGFSGRSYTDKELRFLEKTIYHCFYNRCTLVFSADAQLGDIERLLTPAAQSALHSVIGKNVVNILR